MREELIFKNDFLDIDLNCKGFEVVTKADDSDDDFIFIKGIANAPNVDRIHDRIEKKVWNRKALANFKKNPVLLNGHNHSDVIGRVDKITVTDNGLEIEARISKSWEKAWMIEQKLMKALSVGIRIFKMVFNEDEDVFDIKELELLEISTVAVGMHQDALFDLVKNFSNDTKEKINFCLTKSDNSMFKSTDEAKTFVQDIFKSIGAKLGLKLTGEETPEELKTAIEGAPSFEDAETAVKTLVDAQIETALKAYKDSLEADADGTFSVEEKDFNDMKESTKAATKAVAEMKTLLETSKGLITDLTTEVNTLKGIDGTQGPDGSTTVPKTTSIEKTFATQNGMVAISGDSKY